MDKTNIPERIDRHRRHLFSAGAMTLAAAQFGMISPAVAQPGNTEPAPLPATTPAVNRSFGPLKQIDAGVLLSSR